MKEFKEKLLGGAVGIIVLMSIWTVKTVDDVKTQVAVLSVRVDNLAASPTHQNRTATNEQQHNTNAFALRP